MNIGTHFIVDLFEIDNNVFETILSEENYMIFFNKIIESSLNDNKMTLISKSVHHFHNLSGAFTSLYLLSESHLSFHSWPEHNYIACDIFTCGDCDTKQIVDDIISVLKPKRINIEKLVRG